MGQTGVLHYQSLIYAKIRVFGANKAQRDKLKFQVQKMLHYQF